mmetsp:Transcript_16507/g.56239  ORF Transcript_16507/g.56239 Transcript_16507/m.56239 type:complete len:146 (-) Transcript_16507:229-666(-)
MCRAEARKLWEKEPELAALGVKMVALVHEDVGTELADFKAESWKGDLYIDEDKVFYKQLFGGKEKWASLSTFLNPFSAVYKNVKKMDRKEDKMNFTGEGRIMGGLVVVSGKLGVSFEHRETTFGDVAEPEEVVEAARNAVKALTN